MEHMRILHICPASRADSPLAPESLQYLGHQIERLGLDELAALDPGDSPSTAVDVIVADACLDLSLAPTIAEAVAAKNIAAPVIVVLSEGGLATASARWGVADIMLTTAGPAEVDARLRMARDRFTALVHTTAGPGRASTPGSAGGLGPAGRSRAEGGLRSGVGHSGSGGHPGFGQLAGGGRQIGFGTRSSSDQWGISGQWGGDSEPMVVVSGALRIDETSFTADLGGRSLDLTYREFALLKYFAMNPDRVFTRDEILLGVWGDDYFGGTRTVDVHVRRLRAKLGKDLETAIHTVRNVGYRFSPDSVTEDEADSVTEDETDATDEPSDADDGTTSAQVEEPHEAEPPKEEDVKV